MFLFGCLCVNAQTPPAPTPVPTPLQTSRDRTSNDVRIGAASAREVEDAFYQLRMLELMRNESIEIDPLSAISEVTQKFYRKPNKKEMKLLAPTQDYLNKYSAFLQQPDTGIIKLNADSSCVESRNVISVKENCLQYSMPGAGTAYSFRVESHRLPYLADLTLSKDVLKNDGVLQHGIMVSLGNVPIEDVTLQTNGLKYLVNFEPLLDSESLKSFDSRLIAGIKNDGFVYGLGFFAKNQTTYALRSIAYKGKVIRAYKGVNYNELDYDKRKDIIVAFRIVDREANGNLTILWKILARKDSPTLKSKPKKDDK
jgi:hypothetical protein